MASPDNDDRERLKSALWFAVGQIVDEECLRRNRNATPQFIGALTEMVWTQIGKKTTHSPPHSSQAEHLTRRAENVAIDLESFANHASRPNVTTEDVLLLARKNPDLQQIMGEFVDERKGIKEAKMARSKAGGRRR
ncbi:Histone-fold protein [Metarhizium robertsii ARSEF 23]|uniref:Histone-fold protein n=1 Tax=Metarhizium robertsii (strain ARSEF 23 / ATCC MYA-3075) TaxID=655844 RepID=E9EKI5_METRA|nr:Histone-fold protein [Metarhizium robertsii ARSEF 23]EFZ03059.1 Histone-fold protein [Metarhizium robertsii ARSEF 23]